MRVAQGIRERGDNRRRRALARAVWALPIETRQAMLGALEDEELIVGGYTDRLGRACPWLAAFRRGARSDAGAFSAVWDRFGRAHRPRPATGRELEILRALLEESLGESGAPRPSPALKRQPILTRT